MSPFRLKALRFVSAILATLVAAGPVLPYEASRGPTEVVYWDSDKAYNGYTVVSPSRVDGVYLLDMAGEVVKYWPELTGLYLAQDGTLVGSKRGVDFVEVDWDGNVLWEYTETRESYHPHHDDLRIYNAALGQYTRLFIANVDMSHDEVIALGADPARVERYEDVQMDAIVEVDRDGNVVWEWHFSDHLIQDRFPSKQNHVGEGRTLADHPGRLDINWGVPSVDYMHSNGIDYNPELGHIAISSNRFFEIYIIDHDGTFVAGDPEESRRLAAGEAGDFLYRFGNPANYGQGDFRTTPTRSGSSCRMQATARSAGTTISNGSGRGCPAQGTCCCSITACRYRERNAIAMRNRKYWSSTRISTRTASTGATTSTRPRPVTHISRRWTRLDAVRPSRGWSPRRWSTPTARWTHS